jgi:hypothetical protein
MPFAQMHSLRNTLYRYDLHKHLTMSALAAGYKLAVPILWKQ